MAASELVRFNDATKKFEVSSKASAALRALQGPICVVAVCGRARQGKSFLLNQLLNRLQRQAAAASGSAGGGAGAEGSGFLVGNTVRPCTKGLWLWSKPIPRTMPNGQPYHLLLLDAEGIDSYDQTNDYSNHIFSLALLLSSLLVYNQMGSIDESSVDKLAAVCEFARLIRGKAGQGADGSDALMRDLSPTFMWLLRDFQFQLTEEGRQLSVRDYMEEVLRDVPGSGEAIRAKNQVRASIKSLFPERDCAALVRPMLDEAKLARMDALPYEQLRPEFRKGLESLVETLLSRARPKSLRGQLLTGPALAALAEGYVRVINDGQVPAIASTWQSVVQSECRRALDAAGELYKSKMEPARSPEVGVEQLDSLHAAALEAAVEAFGKQALGEPAEREAFVRRLRDLAVSLVGPLRAAKRAEAEARTTQLLAEAGRKFLASVSGESPDLAAAEASLHAFLRDYAQQQQLGPDRFIKVGEFLAGTVVPELRRLATAAAGRAAAAGRRVEELEAKVAELTARADGLRASLDTSTAAEASARRELAAAQGSAAATSTQLAAATAALEAARREAEGLRSQLAAARVEAAGKDEKAAAEVTRLKSELALAAAQRAAAETAAAAATAARGQAAEQLAARDAVAATTAAEAAALRAELEGLRRGGAEAQGRLEALQAQLAGREAELSHLKQERHFMQVRADEQARELAELRDKLQAATAAASEAAAREAVASQVAAREAAAAAAAREAAAREVAAEQARRAAAEAAAAAAASEAAAREAAAAAAAREEQRGQKRGRAPGDVGGRDEVEAEDVEMEDGGQGGEGSDAAAAAAGAEAAAAAATTGKKRKVTAARTRGAAATPPKGRAAAAAIEDAAAAVAVAGTPAGAVRADGGAAQGTPFSSEREVRLRKTPPADGAGPSGSGAQGAAAGGTPAGAGAAASPRPALPLPADVEKMTINELKDWLTTNGFEDEVFKMGAKRPSKKDWVSLVRSKCGQ